MSKLYDLRVAIKTAIVAEDLGLAEDDIIIARQADIFTEIEQRVSAATNGVVLVISAAKKTNEAPKLEKPRWKVTLKLTLWVRPIWDTENKPEEDISELLDNFIAQLDLTNNSPSKCQKAIEVMESNEIPDPDYLVRELTIQTLIQN